MIEVGGRLEGRASTAGVVGERQGNWRVVRGEEEGWEGR